MYIYLEESPTEMYRKFQVNEGYDLAKVTVITYQAHWFLLRKSYTHDHTPSKINGI